MYERTSMRINTSTVKELFYATHLKQFIPFSLLPSHPFKNTIHRPNQPSLPRNALPIPPPLEKWSYPKFLLLCIKNNLPTTPWSPSWCVVTSQIFLPAKAENATDGYCNYTLGTIKYCKTFCWTSSPNEFYAELVSWSYPNLSRRCISIMSFPPHDFFCLFLFCSSVIFAAAPSLVSSRVESWSEPSDDPYRHDPTVLEMNLTWKDFWRAIIEDQFGYRNQ